MGTIAQCHVIVEYMANVITLMDVYVMMDGVVLIAISVSWLSSTHVTYTSRLKCC